MRLKNLLAAMLLFCVSAYMMGARTITEVTQPPTASGYTSVGENVDYTITSTTPFTNTKKLRINNKTGVIIIKNLKPSVVIANWVNSNQSFVRIGSGTDNAVDGVNCQVRMYNKGTIILPYVEGDGTAILTTYTGTNQSGTSYTNYSTGHSGGFMKTLTEAQGLNNFKSFKLKRGYMVTFATGTGGWGYSRCFVAAYEDLTMDLPAVLAGNVSSYRIFPFYNFSKSALASDGRMAANQALNSTGCYDWGTGTDTNFQDGNGTWIGNYPDTEWIPNHIYEDWPSPAACGERLLSPHMKTNNEPLNGADDHPQDLATILGNWQNLMRTGQRLCSPTSWDGSDWWNGDGFLKGFINEIDARGWRCDIIDAHCYWPDGNFANLENYWWPSMHRPIWISEWVWGASWNSNGCFASGQTEANIVNTTRNILSTLNNSAHVERYFYWNGEAEISRVYNNDALTAVGEVYAATDGGCGFNPDYQFIPTVVLKRPYGLAGSINGNNVSFSWYSPNGDMAGDVKIQYKTASATTWNTLATQHAADKTSSSDATNAYSGTLANAGNYVWRVVETYDNTEYATDVFSTVVEQNDNLTYLPSNLGDYYFQFYSKEASSDLCWASFPSSESENRVYYKAKNTNDPYQLWCIENNASNGGYSFRNLGEPSTLVSSPAAWNFITRNTAYTVAAAQTAFLPVYKSSGDYWVVQNCAHSGNYVGLWDNDKNFAAGELLAGNRDSETTADHIGIRAIPRSTINSSMGIETTTTPTANSSYYIYNVESGKFLVNGNDSGTRASLGDTGLLWTMEAGNNSGLYSFKNSATSLYLYVTDEDNMWVDGASSIGDNSWTDVTGTYMTNANFASADGWTIVNKVGGPDQNMIEFYAGWGSLERDNYSVLQSITLPAGTYKLVGHAFYRQGVAYNTNSGKSLAYLKAGNNTKLLPTLGSVSLGSYADNFNEAATVLAGETYAVSLEFTLAASSTIEVGVTGTFDEAKCWCPVGSFKLYDKSGNGDPTKTRDFQVNLGSDGYYTFQVEPTSSVYGTSALGTRYVGGVGDFANSPYVFPCPKETYATGVAKKWLFMEETAYNLYRSALNNAATYRADMWPSVRAAKAKGIGSEEIAVFENIESTVADLISAKQSLNTKLLALEATEENPVDYTFLIKNADCASSSFEGWTSEGGWGNNYYHYHNGDAMLANRFYESWVGGGGQLADRTLSQTISNLPAGKYQAAIDIVATQQGDANVTVTGINFFLGDQKVACATGNGAPQCFTTPTFTLGSGDDLTLGVEVASTTANWVAFDNFRLTYLGGGAVTGDVTGEGDVNLADVAALVKYLLGKPNSGVANDAAADVDGNGAKNLADVTKLINIILGR